MMTHPPDNFPRYYVSINNNECRYSPFEQVACFVCNLQQFAKVIKKKQKKPKFSRAHTPHIAPPFPVHVYSALALEFPLQLVLMIR